MTCAGNAQEICGADLRINIYSSTETITYNTASPNGKSSCGGLTLSDKISIAVSIVGVFVGVPSMLLAIRMWRRLRS
jgi:hypothetical protein